MVFDSRNGFQLDDSEIPVSHQLCQKTKIDRSADHHCNGKGVLGRWPCAQGSVEPEKPSSQLRSVGDSPGDETGRSVILAPKSVFRVLPFFTHRTVSTLPFGDHHITISIS